MPPLAELPAAFLALERENIALRAQVEWMKKQMFGGGKSEKLDPAQLQIKLSDQQQLAATDQGTERISYERRRASQEKRPLRAETFAKLPVSATIVIEPAEVQAAPEQYERIGEERSFEVDVVPPKLFKREFVRPKYRTKGNRDLAPVVAPARVRPVEGGYASAGLLAWILNSKYVDHQPLYRLAKMSARWGASLPRQSMAEWVRIAAMWLEPLYERMHRRLLDSGYVQADDVARSAEKRTNAGAMSRPGLKTRQNRD
ncbi:MAG: transposase [Candidatus Synoicihabitans palmerolidicus]|nr:transposase [Candidatus Synoicihabitans palmerolidicus]